VDWEKKSYNLSAGSRTLKWVYVKDSSVDEGEDCGWVDALTVGTGSITPNPDELSEALDSDLYFTTRGTNNARWWPDSGSFAEYYYEDESAQSSTSLSDSEESCMQTIVDIDSSETLKFYWKVSCQEDSDYLEFYIDDTRQDRITGDVDWTQKSYTVSSGIHTLKWRYISGGGDSGDNCGWVDYVQWTGLSPARDPDNWQEITYKHDVHGRRIEKKVESFRIMDCIPQTKAESYPEHLAQM